MFMACTFFTYLLSENQKVFFKAQLDSGPTTAIAGNQVIRFGEIQHNQGNSYNRETGKFTAPVSGMYQFTFHLCPNINNDAFYGLVHNGIFLVTGEIFNSAQEVCFSHTEIVQVQKGDTVWVQNRHATLAFALYENDWHDNTFSGFLLQKL